MISLSAIENRSKLRGGHGAPAHLLLVTVKGTLSVPKNARSVCTIAELMQVWPEG